MARSNRASMREGPLAALFRRTDQDVPEEAREQTRQERPTEHRGLLEDTERPRVPNAQERLSSAFSHDIPHDVLERPAREYRPRDDPAAAPRPTRQPVLRVVGVGGAGVNAVDRMVEAGVEGVEFIAVNTDLQSLEESAAHVTLHIGADLTHGLGSGSDPKVGRQAALVDDDRIKSLLKGSDLVFVTAGVGGGTGTGAAPIVASIAQETGALTVGVVTKPFGFEGSQRAGQAEEGVKELAKHVDTLIVIPNNRLLSVLERGTTMIDAFRVADDVLRQGVQGISDLVTLPGLINLDFADVRTIMTNAGQALLGIGMATGERRAIEAAEQAVSSPLLETSVEGARSILLSITGGRDLSLWEVNEAARAVSEAAHPSANIIFGAMIDEKIDDECWVTVVATGYGDKPVRRSGTRKLEEPLGEPRVRRNRPDDVAFELEVPEFIPGR
jgi:cell division protein FtsZ